MAEHALGLAAVAGRRLPLFESLLRLVGRHGRVRSKQRNGEEGREPNAFGGGESQILAGVESWMMAGCVDLQADTLGQLSSCAAHQIC